MQRDVADQRSVTERSTRSGNSGKLPENAVNEVGWRQLLEEQPIFPRGQSSAAQESIRIRVHGGSSSSFYAAVIRVQYYSVSFSFRCKEDRLFITRSSDKLWKFKLSPYHDDFWINISFFGKEYQLKKRINQELVSQEFFLLDIYYTILGISKFKVKV